MKINTKTFEYKASAKDYLLALTTFPNYAKLLNGINKPYSILLNYLIESELTLSNEDIPFPSMKELSQKFGIVAGKKPEDIILSFEQHQGKYIKTLPLHETQEIVIDNEDELQVRLKLCITFDFIMELLSYGEDVMVIKPKTLAKKMKLTLDRKSVV